jgi:hypothetical protein
MLLHEHKSLVQVLGLSSFSYITAVSIITKNPCRDSKYEHEAGSRIRFKNYLLGKKLIFNMHILGKFENGEATYFILD